MPVPLFCLVKTNQDSDRIEHDIGLNDLADFKHALRFEKIIGGCQADFEQDQEANGDDGSLQNRYQYFTCADMSRLQQAGYTSAPDRFQEFVARYVRDYLVPGCKYYSQV